MMTKFRDWPPVAPHQAKRVTDAAAFLDQYVAAANEVWAAQAFTTQVVADSHYEAACRLARGRWAFDLARLHLSGSEDHLVTVATILGSGRLPAWAGYSVLRASLEASARACWLLDPNLSPRQRQERGFTEQLNHLQGLQTFSRHRESRRKLIVDLRTEAAKAGLQEKFGISTKKSQSPPLRGFGIIRPGPTELILGLLPHKPTADDDAEGGFLYRLLSGSAHSEPWALLANSEEAGFVEPGVPIRAFEVKLEVLMPAISKTVALYDRALGLHTRLMGYDEGVWEVMRGPLPHL